MELNYIFKLTVFTRSNLVHNSGSRISYRSDIIGVRGGRCIEPLSKLVLDPGVFILFLKIKVEIQSPARLKTVLEIRHRE
jgi:hypothetical protein